MCARHFGQKWRAENPPEPGSNRPRTRKYILKQHGLTEADYEAMVAEQRGRCAICQATSPGNGGWANNSWCVDHDHVTGQVRGLLCRTCNTAIGLLKDDPDIVTRAAAYLRKHRQMPLPLTA